MRVAIIADTHGFLDPRIAAVVAECDMAVHAGDVGGADVLLALLPRQEVVAIRGNNDSAEHWGAGEQNMLATLPRTRLVTLPGGAVKVIHGDDSGSIAARHRRYRRRFADAEAVIYGHSHRMTVDCDERPWLLNPGAAGRTRTYGGPSCLLLDCTRERWRLTEYRFEPRPESTDRKRRVRHQRAHGGGS